MSVTSQYKLFPVFKFKQMSTTPLHWHHVSISYYRDICKF